MKEQSVQRISIRNLVQAVVCRWRLWLILAVVLALAGGVWSVAGALPALLDKDVQQAEQAAYEQALAEYEVQKASLTAEADRAAAQVASFQAYLDESLQMRINPYDAYEGSLSVYVEAADGPAALAEDENAGTDATTAQLKAGAIVQLYQSAVTSEEFLAPAAEAIGVETKYLRQVVTTKTATVGGTIGPTLTVCVAGESQEQVETVLDVMESQLKTVQREIRSAAGEHTAAILLRNVRNYSDQTILDARTTASDRMTKLTASLEAVQGELNSLRAPGAPTYTVRGLVKGIVKYALVFGAVGFLLGCFWICIQFIAGDRVYSGREIDNRCCVELLGSLSLVPGKRRSRKLLRLEERGVPGDGAAIDRIAAQIARNNDAGQPVMLTGEADEAHMQALCDALEEAMPGVRICAYGSVLEDGTAIRTVGAPQVIVLAEQCGLARYSTINRQADRIQTLGGKVLGCIALDN